MTTEARAVNAFLEGSPVPVLSTSVDSADAQFQANPPDIEAGLAQLRLVQRSIDDALVPLMTGLVKSMGWMH